MIVRSAPTPLRVAVVGVGNMGQNHARVLSSLSGAELVAVLDPDAERARAVTATYGGRVFGHPEDLLGKVDAVTICTPSINHAEIGQFFLDNGIHCLIEKPLATTEADCLSLIEAAERQGLVLLVGHIERFNPAVRQLKEVLEGNRIFAIEARRMSFTSSRIVDVDVVLDLMIHDIDIVLSLVGQMPDARVLAHGTRAPGSPSNDFVTALLPFPDGIVANITASRVTQSTLRELHVSSEAGFMALNYRNQDLQIFRQQRDAEFTPRGNYRLDVSIERVLVRSIEPLVAELQHFLQAVQQGNKPLVSGREALEALRVAWAVQSQLGNIGR